MYDIPDSHSFTDPEHSDTDLQTTLEQLEATHRLYRLFDTFITNYDTSSVEHHGNTLHVDEAYLDDLTTAFAEQYGDTFLEANPAITDDELAQYRQLPDELRTDLTAAMATTYIKQEHGQHDPLFTINGYTPDTDTDDDTTTGTGTRPYLKAGITAAGVIGLISAGLSGAAAADAENSSTPEYTNASDRYAEDDGLPDPDDHNSSSLEGADPDQMDVFVEVDTAAECGIDPGYFDEVEELFDDAPVTNPDGSTGINLHINYSDTIDTEDHVDINDQNGSGNDLPDLQEAYFDNDGQGHHYAAIVPNATNGGEYSATEDDAVLGVARPGEFLVACDDRPPEEIKKTFTHELGHSLGLSSNDFEGVDSTDIPFDEYPSVMNYNNPDHGENTYIYFSDGSNSENDFDDWAHIVDELHTPEVN